MTTIIGIICLVFGFLGLCYYLIKADRRAEDIRRMKYGYRDSSKNPFNKDNNADFDY
jgi:hypothetical protein